VVGERQQHHPLSPVATVAWLPVVGERHQHHPLSPVVGSGLLNNPKLLLGWYGGGIITE